MAPIRFLIRVHRSPTGGVLAKRAKGTSVEITDDPVEVCITVSRYSYCVETLDASLHLCFSVPSLGEIVVML